MDPQGFQQWTRPLSIMPRSTSSKCPLINRLESSICLFNKAKYLSPASCCGCGSWSIRPSSTWSRRRLPRRCCCCRDGGECDLFCIKLFSMIPMAGFAAVQGHDDKSSNVSRWFLISSSCGSSNGITRTKCFGGGGSNVRAWTQCLCGCFYGIDGLWPPGGISKKISTPWPFDTQSHLLESTFHLLLLPGFSCGPLSISSKLSGSDILRSALRRPDGTVRSDGLPTRGCSPRIPIARSTKEGVKKRSSDTSCELLLNP